MENLRSQIHLRVPSNFNNTLILAILEATQKLITLIDIWMY